LKMAGKLEVCGISAGVGAVSGGLIGGATGLALGIWACVQFIEPALEETDALSAAAAKGITAAIALFGGLEATTSLGVCVGAAAGAILTPIASGIAYGAVKTKEALEGVTCSSFSFFGKSKPKASDTTAPVAEIRDPALNV
jgi:hypothetical protein